MSKSAANSSIDVWDRMARAVLAFCALTTAGSALAEKQHHQHQRSAARAAAAWAAGGRGAKNQQVKTTVPVSNAHGRGARARIWAKASCGGRAVSRGCAQNRFAQHLVFYGAAHVSNASHNRAT